MPRKAGVGNISMTSYSALFNNGTQVTSKEQVQTLPLTDFHTFTNHPYKVKDDEEMQKLVESISNNGVLLPILARPRKAGGYEIIAGHRRVFGSRSAGLTSIPAIIRELDDNVATILMVDSNIQRENILPSERAFAYKMRLDAMKRIAGRPPKRNTSQVETHFEGTPIFQGKTKSEEANASQVETQKRSDQQLAEEVGVSRNQVQRFIRLTYLIPELLNMVDDKKISFNSAVNISYLKPEDQTSLLEVIRAYKHAPTLAQSKRLKGLAQDNQLTPKYIQEIMAVKNQTPWKLTLNSEQIQSYFSEDYTPDQMAEIVIQLLKEWSGTTQK